MGVLKTVGNIYFVYQFLKKLVTPFEKTTAFELGIIDKKGNECIRDYRLHSGYLVIHVQVAG